MMSCVCGFVAQAWKNLPSKCAQLKEELASLKLFLKSDNACFSGEKGSQRRAPTIPCVLLFLIHVQQQEIGGFKLANGMFRWSKMKSVFPPASHLTVIVHGVLIVCVVIVDP